MKLTIIASLLLIVSCTSQKEVMNTWINHPQQELVMKWGPPAHTTSDGGDGKVLIYSKTVYNPMLNLTSYYCRMFYVNKRGNIYHWLTQNSTVPPQQVNVTLSTAPRTIITGY